MEMDKKIRRIADAYYNRGLSKAKTRDLTGAAEDLKKCLRYNKYHTDARNLLGLIYNEIGEVGAALVQWVISLNLQEEGNLAEEYLSRVREQHGYLEIADQAAKKYNQALIYAQNDNEDLAILLLMRMLEEFPQFVKAQELLALLYIHHEDYTKAGRCLYQATKIDRYNPQAQYYMSIAKRNTGRAEVERRKLKNAFSHRQMQDDDIIMPPTYKENTGWQSVLNILAGLVIGMVAAVFLILPANREALNRSHNEELLGNLELMNQKSLQIDSLEREIAAATAAKELAEEELASFTDENSAMLEQYRNLVQILKYLESDQISEASLVYVQTDWSILQQEESLADTLTQVYQVMAETGYRLLERMGDTAMEENDPAGAIGYYQDSLSIREDNVAAIYKIGVAYQAMGDTEAANQCFGDVIMNHADSEYAEVAKERRGY